MVTAVTGTSLSVQGKETEWTFTVDEKTQILATGASTKTRQKTAANEKTAITDFVAPGDSVMVRFTDLGDSKRASHIRVTRKAAAPK